MVRHEPLREKTFLLTCAPNEDLYQSALLCSLIIVFVVRMENTLASLAFLNALSEDFDQTSRMRRLI